MKKLMILAAAALLSLFAGGCGDGAAANGGGNAVGQSKELPACCANRAAEAGQTGAVRRVSAAEAERMMAESSGFILLDVRTPGEYADGHIPNALNLPNETIGAEPPAILPDKSQRIFVYCRSGRRSQDAAAKLAAMGYADVVDFGGISDWRGEIAK